MTFNKLFKESQKFHPTYAKGQLAIHLPMSLIALKKMNAYDEQLQLFYENNYKKYELRNVDTLTITNISEAIGKSHFFESTYNYFSDQLLKHSLEHVLTETLPLLIKGLFTSAFHPAIRLSYAIDLNDNKEISMALASWTTEYNELTSKLSTCNKSLSETMLSVNPIGINHTFSPGNIVARMLEIDNVLQKKGIVFQAENISFEKIRSFCINAYAMQNNFTLLHTVTACHAFSLLQKYIHDKDLALKYLWQSVVTAYLSTGLKYETFTSLEYRKTNKNKFKTSSDWESILKLANSAKDEHIVKIVYTSWCEFKKYKLDLYQFVAERAVSNI